MGKSRNKYNARKTMIDGIVFDSKAEAERYLFLKSEEQAGNISNLCCHPRYVLQPSFKVDGKTIRAITYTADFSYTSLKGIPIVEDVKGVKTAVYNLKKRMFLYQYPDLYFQEVKA